HPAWMAFHRLSTLRDGITISVKHSSRLLQQPVVLRFSKLMQEANDELSTNFVANREDAAFTQLYTELGTKLTQAEMYELNENPVLFSPQKLLEMLQPKERNKDYYKAQYSALRLFEELYW